MSRYRTISVKMWGDDRFLRLSKPQPNGQTLWIYLLTGPHTLALPGAFVAGEAMLAESLGWSLTSLRKALAEVIREGLIEADIKTRLVFIPKALRHNPPQSLNVVVGWRKAFNELPDCVLKQRIFEHVTGELGVLGKSQAFVEAFGDAFKYVIAYPEQNKNKTIPEQNKNKTIPEQNKSIKSAYGQNGLVLLTEEEHRKLMEQFGPDGTSERIKSADLYIGSTGKKYQSHYMTILSWENKKNGAHQQNGNQATRSSGIPKYTPKQ